VEARERLERLIRYSVEGIRRHHVAVSYTNIFVMKTWNCIAIGEQAGFPDLAAEGYGMLDAWLDHTRENGIHEYLSPTYYPVSMQPLEMIAQHAKPEAVRQKAARALWLFWAQIAANWFAPCNRLGGAHSRDYDYLSTGPRGNRIAQRMQAALGYGEDADLYFPDMFLRNEMHVLVDTVPRMVYQRWGPGPGETAAQFLGHRFSIGSAGAGYGPIDKCLTVNLGGPETPMVTFVVDARGDAYGVKRFGLADGHQKALHQTPFLTSVQRGPEALMLAAAIPEGRHFHRSAPNPTCWLSHLVLPDTVDVWIGDARVDIGDGPKQVAVPAGGPVFLRLGDVAVGVRFALALDTAGGAAPVALVRDEEGMAHGAMRLTCTHSDRAPDGRGIVALWVRGAEDLDEAGFAAFREGFSGPVEATVNGDVVEVSVAGLADRMRLVADVGKQARMAVEGAGPDATDALLVVNGRDVGREIMD